MEASEGMVFSALGDAVGTCKDAESALMKSPKLRLVTGAM